MVALANEAGTAAGWLLDAVLVRDEAGEKRGPVGPRGRRAGGMEGEQGATTRQQVQVRGTDLLVAVAAQRESRQAFGKDQEDVRPRRDTILSQQGRGACQEKTTTGNVHQS